MKKIYGKMLLVGAAAAVCVVAGNANARVTGVCSDCHTMHNSQDGKSMQFAADASPTQAKRALTRGGCVGCHTSSDGAVLNGPGGVTPMVNTTAAGGPTGGNVLAGGNFFWVQTVDATGHNVVNISLEDQKIAGGVPGYTPPGWKYDTMFANTAGKQVTAAGTWGQQLTCAGTYGCHGNHASVDDFQDISGAHHANDTAGVDGSTVGKSYRFLTGIVGKESLDWENPAGTGSTPLDPTGKNVYKGKARTSDETGIDNSTISFLCAECHGNFHSGVGNAGIDDTWGTPWLRHPVDFDMAEKAVGTEYQSYVYTMQAPVAVETLTLIPGDKSGGALTAKANIVTCISCHRAHGSAYDDLLRWEYITMDAHSSSGGNVGCFACHTTKDT